MCLNEKLIWFYISMNAVTLKRQLPYYGKIMHFLRKLLTVYCGVCWNLKCVIIKLHKCNVALFDIVKITGDGSPIDNSGAEESVGRAELSVPMIVLSSSDGSDVF